MSGIPMKQGFVICTHRKTRLFLKDCLASFVKPNLIGEQVYQRYPVCVVATDEDHDLAHEVMADSVPRLVLVHNKCWEVNALRAAWESTDWDELFFLQDTFELVDPVALAKLAFEDNRGKACPVNGAFQMYAGKYRRSGLNNVNWPAVENKADAVRQESLFTRHYLDVEPAERQVLFPNFRDSQTFIEKHGRLNMVSENAYIRKWKGTWQENLSDRIRAINEGAV